MCFAKVPPEVNSGRLIYGPGSDSMARAAKSWDELAAALRATAACYDAVIAGLAGGWPAPITLAIGSALAPYVAWLTTGASHAAQAATQLAAAVSAHEAAVSAMVPIDRVASNRMWLVSLAATNALAQTSPAIAQIEHEYHQMWVHDAETMYAYARASAKASVLAPFTSTITAIESPEPHGTDVNIRRSARRLSAAPQVIAAGSEVVEAIPEALQAISVSGQTTLDVHLASVTPALSALCSWSAQPDVAIQHLQAMNRWMTLLRAAVLSAHSKDCVAPRLGKAGNIGVLSVPPSWSARAAHDKIDDDQSRWVREPLRLVKVNARGGRSTG